MANSGPGTNGSQFYITIFQRIGWTINILFFGHVVEGQDIVDSVEQGDVLESIEIIREERRSCKLNAIEALSLSKERVTNVILLLKPRPKQQWKS
jgi:peptidyl-prolyl cis-trans isomerase A (cyclophilin A)